MKSKRALSLLLILTMVLSLAGVASAEKAKVNLWTIGSQNVSDMFTACIAAYNQLPDAKAEVTLQFILSGAGDTQLYDRLGAAYKTGQQDSGFDIVAENSTSLAQYVAAAGSPDLFANLDFDKIPNYANVKIKSAFDNAKVVPYRGTTVVFAYDSARVKEPPKTWAELTQWIKDNPGRFAYNPPATGGAGASFVRTVLYKDQPVETWISSDPANKAFWEAGFDYLKEIHPSLYQSGGGTLYPNKNQGTLDLLINKEVDIIPAWADQVLSNLASGTLPETVKMMQLDQSLSGTDVVLAVPSIGSNAEACYDFINFMISPEAQKICLETMYAIPVIDPSAVDSDKKDLVAALDVSKFAIMSIGGLDKELNDKWDNDIGTLG
ncbi:MAG: extracellular solute-binding protein [Christensenellaceae bacterium]|nr:extracellular solute-binding protein [Christensenellaceae bacterium]